MRLVAEGYVSPEDLDKTVRDGLGLRWSFMGPLATIELNAPGGVEDYCARYSGFYRRLASAPPPPSVWGAEAASRVAAALGPPASKQVVDARMRWRDRRLMALVRHKLDQPDVD
jgi:3-hydroxyacyl-CoA dehydrogenase